MSRQIRRRWSVRAARRRRQETRADSGLAGSWPLRDQGGRDRRETFAAAGQAEPVRGRSGHPDDGAAEGSRQGGLRLVPTGGEPRLVADDLDGYVADQVTGLIKQRASMTEQRRAARVRPLRPARPELAAQVAEAGGGQLRVADRVRGDITIGMACQALLARPVQRGEVQLAPGSERVYIDP